MANAKKYEKRAENTIAPKEDRPELPTSAIVQNMLTDPISNKAILMLDGVNPHTDTANRLRDKLSLLQYQHNELRRRMFDFVGNYTGPELHPAGLVEEEVLEMLYTVAGIYAELTRND